MIAKNIGKISLLPAAFCILCCCLFSFVLAAVGTSHSKVGMITARTPPSGSTYSILTTRLTVGFESVSKNSILSTTSLHVAHVSPSVLCRLHLIGPGLALVANTVCGVLTGPHFFELDLIFVTPPLTAACWLCCLLALL
jgi:hypothetical protein